MATINWNEGQLITLTQGDTASCTGNLNHDQLYCLFFYNAAQADAATNVSVVWENGSAPTLVEVPGTTQEQGLASLCFVSDTNSVSASVLNNQPGAQVEAFIGSVKMPTNTKGINNWELPLDGQLHPFEKFTRYYAVPASHWYAAQIQSDIDQFISVQFTSSKATVNIVNAFDDPGAVIYYTGSTKERVTVKSVQGHTLAWNLNGNGQQLVWINADSVQNSQNATITVQSLSGAYAAL